MKQSRTSTDRHYLAGLTSDKLYDRLRNLGECLNSLFIQLGNMNTSDLLKKVGIGVVCMLFLSKNFPLALWLKKFLLG